jgi:hypothetical protein
MLRANDHLIGFLEDGITEFVDVNNFLRFDQRSRRALSAG